MVRMVSCDWGVEREPRLAIERLDAPASKGRVSLDDLAHRFSEIPAIARKCALEFPQNVQQQRDDGLVNKLKVVDFTQLSGISRQAYYEGSSEIDRKRERRGKG